MLKLSYSRMATYQSCQRKFYWVYVRRIVPLSRQLPLEFGTAWHKAMEVWHRDHNVSTAMEAFDASYTDDPNDSKRTRDTAHRMLKLYTERFVDDPFTIVAHEQWYEIPYPNEVLYRLRIDRIINWDGEVKGMEHKTTSSLGFHYLKQFKPNLQLAGYVKALQQFVDPAINKMVMDIALVVKLEPREGERFVRYPETIQPWELTEFNEIVMATADDLEGKGIDFSAYTPNWNACTQYGECAYRALCIAPPSIREQIIRNQYQLKPEEGVADVKVK